MEVVMGDNTFQLGIIHYRSHVIDVSIFLPSTTISFMILKLFLSEGTIFSHPLLEKGVLDDNLKRFK